MKYHNRTKYFFWGLLGSTLCIPALAVGQTQELLPSCQHQTCLNSNESFEVKKIIKDSCFRFDDQLNEENIEAIQEDLSRPIHFVLEFNYLKVSDVLLIYSDPYQEKMIEKNYQEKEIKTTLLESNEANGGHERIRKKHQQIMKKLSLKRCRADDPKQIK